MERDHLEDSEKREDQKLTVEPTLRKTILQTSLQPKHKVTLELEACGSARASIATVNVKMTLIPDSLTPTNIPPSLEGLAKEMAYPFPSIKMTYLSLLSYQKKKK